MKISARFYKLPALLAIAGLGLVGCVDDYDPEDTAPDSDNETQSGSVTVGVLNGWDEDSTVSEPWHYLPEQDLGA